MAEAGWREVEAAQADGRWEAAYAPQSTAEPPEDLVAALAASPAAQHMFASIDRANRYVIIYRVQDARKPETRARRIAQFVAMLERGEVLHPAKREPPHVQYSCQGCRRHHDGQNPCPLNP